MADGAPHHIHATGTRDPKPNAHSGPDRAISAETMTGSDRCAGFRFGQFELDTRNRTLSRNGTEVSVEPKVLEFLTYLVQHRDRLVTHDELRSHLWPGIVVAQASIGRLAKEARKLVGDTGEDQHTITTRRGYGYRFVARIEECPTPSTEVDATLGQANALCLDEQDTSNTTVVESRDGALSLSIQWLCPQEFTTRLDRDHALIVGRIEGCDVVLPGAALSRRHARLFPDGPLWLIEDLDSSNGTYVNCSRIRRAPLAPQDVIRLGDSVGVVEAGRLDQSICFRTLALDLVGGRTLERTLTPAWQLASSPHPINLSGPPGAGKRAAAAAIHARSERPGAMVEVRAHDLVEGSGTSPIRREDQAPLIHDYWQRALRGTLLLHDVNELPPQHQDDLVQLLRLHSADPSAPRCISTSTLTLTDAVGRGALSPVLFELLHGLEVRIPSLRQRTSDIPNLFRHFLREQLTSSPPELSARFIERLCTYSWPSNVRELRALAREVLLTHEQATKLDVDNLPPWLSAALDAPLRASQRDSTA